MRTLTKRNEVAFLCDINITQNKTKKKSLAKIKKLLYNDKIFNLPGKYTNSKICSSNSITPKQNKK